MIALLLLLLVVGSSPPVSHTQTRPAKSDSGEEMALIPAGQFVMGKSGEAEDCPVREVRIRTFFLDRHEVTNAAYARFCEETRRVLPEFWGVSKYHSGPDFPDHPVVGISWDDAKAFAKWAGKRLPTEAEWEYAARGSLVGANYPNGDAIDVNQANINTQPRKGTMPVGKYPANAYGLHDMAGNVCEWVDDFYDKDYYRNGPHENPPGPGKGKFRVIRGGGWHSGGFCNRVYVRNALPQNWMDINVGFRCAKDERPTDQLTTDN
jgi:formylglycine-generating enzyme required for sulfatase activity